MSVKMLAINTGDEMVDITLLPEAARFIRDIFGIYPDGSVSMEMTDFLEMASLAECNRFAAEGRTEIRGSKELAKAILAANGIGA
jgi:hypothetical protein